MSDDKRGIEIAVPDINSVAFGAVRTSDSPECALAVLACDWECKQWGDWKLYEPGEEGRHDC